MRRWLPIILARVRLPTWLLALTLAACCAWGYVRLDLLEEGLDDLLEDPVANAGREVVAGYQTVVEVRERDFTIEVDRRPVVVHGRLPASRPGEVASVRVRVRSDGTVDALEVLEHPGRRAKVHLSLAAVLVLAVLTVAWVRPDRSARRLAFRSPGRA